MNDELMDIIKLKNDLWKKALRKRNEFVEVYKKERNRVNNEIKKAKNRFYSNLLLKDNNPKNMWNTINEILGAKGRINNDELITREFKGKNLLGLTNKFNEHYGTIVEKISMNYSELKKIYQAQNNDNTHKKDVSNTMAVFDFSITEVENVINSLQVKKSTGIDGIMLKHGSCEYY